LKFTTDVVTKFVPLTVRVNAPVPAVAEVGCTEVKVGTGFEPETVSCAALDVPPPGAGLVTVTLSAPAVSRLESMAIR